METKQKELYYPHLVAHYDFEGFVVFIVRYDKGPEDTLLEEIGTFHLSAAITGYDFEIRNIVSVENSGSFQSPSANTKVFIKLKEGFHNIDKQVNPLVARFNIQKIYCELYLNPSFKVEDIEDLVWRSFLSNGNAISKKWMHQLLTIINRRWDEFPSLEDLANELDMHPVTISKYFSQNGGLTLSEYMRKIKVQRAVDMLLNSTESFASIAFTCGFSDQSHMNRLIKRYMGQTPSSIRSITK